jgi:NADP-dependent 3-hydroxy acid dehydrogenase YdfG
LWRSKLKGKVAFISGASSGIGLAIAWRLAQAGMQVILSGRRESKLREHVKKIQAAGALAEAVVMDVNEDASMDSALAQSLKTFGAIHALVNNAGFGFWSPLEKTKMEDVDRMLRVNLRAPIYLTRKLLPVFQKQNEGYIVNISSVAGKVGFSNMTHYCASKWGLRGFGEALIEEVRTFGIKVCTVMPGMVNTEFFPPNFHKDRRFMIQPGEVAEAVWSFLSAGEHVTLSEITLRTRVPVPDLA